MEEPGDHQALLLAFFEGSSAGPVQRRTQECSGMLHEAGAIGVTTLIGAQNSSILGRLTDLGWSEDPKPHLTMKVNVPPSRVADLVEESRRDSPSGLTPGVLADVGFGMVRLFWWWGQYPEVPEAFDEPATLKAIQRVRELATAAGGSAIVERCPAAVKRNIDVWGDSPQGIEIMRRIKEKFDPSGILNPGRFVGGI